MLGLHEIATIHSETNSGCGGWKGGGVREVRAVLTGFVMGQNKRLERERGGEDGHKGK